MTKKFITCVKIGNSRPYYLTDNNMFCPNVQKAKLFDNEEEAKAWVNHYLENKPEFCNATYQEVEVE